MDNKSSIQLIKGRRTKTLPTLSITALSSTINPSALDDDESQMTDQQSPYIGILSSLLYEDVVGRIEWNIGQYETLKESLQIPLILEELKIRLSMLKTAEDKQAALHDFAENEATSYTLRSLEVWLMASELLSDAFCSSIRLSDLKSTSDINEPTKDLVNHHGDIRQGMITLRMKHKYQPSRSVDVSDLLRYIRRTQVVYANWDDFEEAQSILEELNETSMGFQMLHRQLSIYLSNFGNKQMGALGEMRRLMSIIRLGLNPNEVDPDFNRVAEDIMVENMKRIQELSIEPVSPASSHSETKVKFALNERNGE